jgi:hypothetical protein
MHFSPIDIANNNLRHIKIIIEIIILYILITPHKRNKTLPIGL